MKVGFDFFEVNGGWRYGGSSMVCGWRHFSSSFYVNVKSGIREPGVGEPLHSVEVEITAKELEMYRGEIEHLIYQAIGRAWLRLYNQMNKRA